MPAERVFVAGDGPEAADLAARLRQAGHDVDVATLADASYVDLHKRAAAASVVVEFIEDSLEQKRASIAALASLEDGPSLLLSSSLRVGPTEVGSWLRDATRVVGFSGLPPFAERKHIELQRGLATGPDAVSRAAELFTSCGFAVETLGDHPGGIQFRIVAGIINEAVSLLAESGATAADIDTAMKLGTNYPHGPLAWADAIGPGRVLAVLEGLEREYREDRYRAMPLLRKMVLAGRKFHSQGDP